MFIVGHGGKDLSIFVSDKRKMSNLSFTSDTRGSNFFFNMVDVQMSYYDSLIVFYSQFI